MLQECVSCDICAIMCIVPRSLADHQLDLENEAYSAAYPASKVSNVSAAEAGAGGPPASCYCPRFPSPADMEYHLSTYLDNWI